MREWQSLPQRSHLCVVSGLSEVLCSFRSAHLLLLLLLLPLRLLLLLLRLLTYEDCAQKDEEHEVDVGAVVESLGELVAFRWARKGDLGHVGI